jgi:hypothetical protein
MTDLILEAQTTLYAWLRICILFKHENTHKVLQKFLRNFIFTNFEKAEGGPASMI